MPSHRFAAAVASGKGGSGKTSTACGLASVLAHQGRRVLALDLDPQGNATWALGADPARPGVAELLRGEPVEPERVADRLHVLAGGPELKAADVARMDPEALADALERLGRRPGPWDALVLDLPPAGDHLERFGLVAADAVLIACDPHPFAVSGAGRVLRDLEHRRSRGRMGAKRWALVLSRLDARRAADRALPDGLRSLWPDVPQLVLRQDAALAAATADRVLVMQAAPTSRAAEDLERIAQWLLDEEVPHGA